MTDKTEKNLSTVQPTDEGQSKPSTISHPLGLYLKKTLLWFGLTWLLVQGIGLSQLWTILVAIMFVAAPIAMGGMYVSTIRKIRKLHLLSPKGYLYRLKSRRGLTMLLWAVWALVSAPFVVLQLHTYETLEILALLVSILPLWYLFKVIGRIMEKETKPFVAAYYTFRLTRWAGVAIVIVIYFALQFSVGDRPSFRSPDEALQVEKKKIEDITGSALMREVGEWMATWNGARRYFLSSLSPDGTVLVAGLSVGAIAFNLVIIFCCFLVPMREFRRILGPLTEDPIPPPLPKTRVALFVFCMTFFSLFIYLPFSAYLETEVRRSGQVTQARKYAERAIRDALKIGDDYFRPEIKMRFSKILEELEREREELVRATLADVDRIFAAQEGQVEAYLDWYYSLGGECSRLAKLLVGQLEKYMEDQLREKLRLGELERQYGDIITEATRKMEGIVKKANAKVYEMKSFYKLGDNELKNYKLHVVETLPSLEELPGFREKIPFETRLRATGVGAFAGAGTGYIATVMVSKAVGKNLVKASAVAVIKALASQGIKVGAGAAGFLAGGPVGAAAGAVAGGLLVDKVALALEEKFSREDHRRQLITLIHDTRDELKQQIVKDFELLGYRP
jgi:hypothetical protein